MMRSKFRFALISCFLSVPFGLMVGSSKLAAQAATPPELPTTKPSDDSPAEKFPIAEGLSTELGATEPATVKAFEVPENDQPESPNKVLEELLNGPDFAPLPEGKVYMNFRDQEWLPALQWMAKQLHLNLDWQTLPPGTFSLFSTQPYEIADAEDQLNMQLLARGFTMLKRGEVLRVVPLKDLDITLVPRVTPEELATLPRHQVVRVSFPLEWMLAEEAVKEFHPLISTYGKLSAISSANRLEAVDAVVNLRDVDRLIRRAEEEDERRERVVEFKLEYRKADEIAPKVRELMGLPPDGSPGRTTQGQLDIEQARFKAEAVKQLGNGARELLSDKKPTMFIVVNDKENSILVNALPDKLEIARQAIKSLDKPLPPTDSTFDTISRVKVHPVTGFDPDSVQKILLALQERGNLAKETRIQHEPAYNRIIAFASPDDQLTIAQLIESFRAEKRTASVVPLSTVRPEYAVKAVQLVLKNPERPASLPGVASDGKFQIEADPDNNRILLWATVDELKEVKEFLKSLGETFEQSIVKSQQVQVVNVGGGEPAEIANRLKRIWGEVSKAPLVIELKSTEVIDSTLPSDSKGSEGDSPSPNRSAEPSSGEPKRKPPELLQSTPKISDSEVVQAARFVSSSNGAANTAFADLENQALKDSTIRIIEGSAGDLMIVSRDPEAVATAKQLLERLTPRSEDLHVVALKHAQGLLVKTQLINMLQHTITTSTSKLALPRATMTIDVDSRTNRLLIQHASPQQIRLIKDIVPVLDRPALDDERLQRAQRVYRFKHRKATEVADVIKDVYRDLLSINDRVYTSNTTGATSTGRPVGYNRNLAATATSPEYQGLLAVGIDAEANSIVISAPTYLIDEVVKLAESVDTGTAGGAFTVIPYQGANQKDAKLAEALSKILKKK